MYCTRIEVDGWHITDAELEHAFLEERGCKIDPFLPLCPVLYLQPCKVPFMVPESLRLPRRETLQTSTALVS